MSDRIGAREPADAAYPQRLPWVRWLAIMIVGAVVLVVSAMHASSSRHVAKTITVRLTGCQTSSSTVTVVIVCPEIGSQGKLVGVLAYSSAIDGTGPNAAPVEGTTRVVTNPAYQPASPKYWRIELIAYLIMVGMFAFRLFKGLRARRRVPVDGHLDAPLSVSGLHDLS